MNKHLSVTLCLLLFVSVGRAQTLTLDSCRRLAVNNSKTIKVAQEKINAARYERKAARSLYFPALDFNAMYFHNQHNVSLFGHSDLLPAIS
ncbi:MAG: TolC family protein, partial [Muribaculaceae bacterium]|nr:TolC family protein [Muribaculaceae bacterium]